MVHEIIIWQINPFLDHVIHWGYTSRIHTNKDFNIPKHKTCKWYIKWTTASRIYDHIRGPHDLRSLCWCLEWGGAFRISTIFYSQVSYVIFYSFHNKPFELSFRALTIKNNYSISQFFSYMERTQNHRPNLSGIYFPFSFILWC